MGTCQIASARGMERDVRTLVERHLEFAHAHTPSAFAFAMGANALEDDRTVSMFCARQHGRVLAVAALRELDPRHGELKSMHTATAVRCSGVGRDMLHHLVAVAERRGYRRLSLETGTGAAFAPARALYASEGFVACGPFGDYRASPHNCFWTLRLGRPALTREVRRS